MRALCCLLLLAACGGDGSGGAVDAGAAPDGSTPVPAADGGGVGGDVSDEAQFLKEYASAVCEMYEPCCEAQELGFDQAGCTAWFRKVTAAYFRGELRADKATACLSALAAAHADNPQRCGEVLGFDEATMRAQCQEAFAASAREGHALGEDCLLAADCASSDEGSVICYSGTCLLQRKGQAGAGPCYAGGRSGLPHELYECAATDGLYCDREANQCAPQVEDGERCPFGNACKPSALCTGGVCMTLPGTGERCLNAIPGAGGFCRAGSSCDVPTLMCGTALAESAACREPAQCASGSCMGGKCSKPEFTRALNCTGHN